jgi:galacturan 1,4-alpha-galacturonidase
VNHLKQRPSNLPVHQLTLHRNMQLFLTALGIIFLPLVRSSGAPKNARSVSCTVTASGGDDGPAFIDAVQRCDTVKIPFETTLSIATKMDMTGLNNKNIVCNVLKAYDALNIYGLQELMGTVKFTSDMTYWINVCVGTCYASLTNRSLEWFSL